MVLYINSCVRNNSRTDRLARSVLKEIGKEYEELKLDEEKLMPYSEEMIEKRTALAKAGDFSNEIFKWARLFAQAEKIVLSAPHWDLSFPALLKLFIENIYVTGLVSEYDEMGRPRGLCKASKLYYVATAGGKFIPDFSYNYIESLCKTCFGIKETQLICAEMLDVEGFDAEKIMTKAQDNIKKIFNE